MKLTIDTKHDTHDDIRKVLHILTHILENKNPGLSSETNLTSETSSSSTSELADSSNLMSMFGDNSSTENKETPDKAPDFSSFMNLVDKKDEDQEKPKLQFF
jgi:hypothetical protein